MKKDVISKEIVKRVIKDLAKNILKIEIKELKLLDTEFERIESRRVDILALVDETYLLHIELQSHYDSNMPYRMLRYYIDIKQKYNFPIKQFVVFLGKGKLKDKIEDEVLKFRYNVIDMKKLDCDIFLNSEVPESLVLSVLCDFKNKKPNKVVEEIIQKLLKISKSRQNFENYILMLEELSSLRDLKELVKESEMILTSKVKWEDLPSYEIGLEKGMEKGIEKEKEVVILNGYKMGLKIEDIALLVNSSVSEVKKVLKRNNVEVN
ncbi:MAG: hypothetical protein ABGX26_01795 [Nautiliaceae bacterium]|jgi:hypothetical protein